MIAPVRKERVITALHWRCKPENIAADWPRDQRLLWLHSGRVHPRWARWCILARPVVTFRFDGRSHLNGELPAALANLELTNDALQDLDALLAATAADSHSPDITDSRLPFRGGWIGYLSYDLGGVIEPRAQHAPSTGPTNRWPLIELAWCPDALLFDHVESRWWEVRECEAESRVAPRPWNIDARAMRGTFPGSRRDKAPGVPREHFTLDALRADIEVNEYERMVARTIEFIAAGDIFQANIAQTFHAEFDGSTRALAIEAFARAQPWYGAYLELGGSQLLKGLGRHHGDSRTVLSLSPELFLESASASGERLITTRPIKGTRPASSDWRELRDSTKDEAELNMIVDLMRNDLGRVCEFGSVRVQQPRTIETHPTVHHGVAEVTGRVRDGATFGEVLRATFPPGSVTGAPKIRAMQIIDELESGRPRGPYCGAIGFISDCGAMTLNVAIRTLLIDGQRDGECSHVLRNGGVTYSAGAGIVADSDPASEQQETLDKIAVLKELAARIASPTPRHEELVADC